MLESKIFKNKTILVTGNTGFQGSWLSEWLIYLGANVIGYSLKPYSEKDNFLISNLNKRMTTIYGNLNDYKLLDKTFKKYNPDIVFHLAAQSLVLESYSAPKETYESNVMGTVNILECSRKTKSVKYIINVTSDKCYQNKEWIWPYRENDPLGGFDPYSSSKSCSEIITNSYRNSFFHPNKYQEHKVSISSVRAGNVLGGGDWHSNNLIPSCINSIEKKEPILLRNPNALRPWQFVLDALYGYLLLVQKMIQEPIIFSDAWNFGPNNDNVISVKNITSSIIKEYGLSSYKVETLHNDLHESNVLLIDSQKSRNKIGWNPKYCIEQIISETIFWYKNYNEQNNISINQIKKYMSY